MVTNTVPPPSLPSGYKTRTLLSWKCPCGSTGEFYKDSSTIEDEEVEHLLKTGCGLSLSPTGERQVKEKCTPPPLPPLPARMVRG
jgi:hypothetical protein